MPSFDMSSMPESMRSKMPLADRQSAGKAGLTSAEAQQKFDDKSEKQLHVHIHNLLRQRNINFVIYSRTDRRTTNAKGVPDFNFPFCGQWVSLEAKVGNNKVSPDQALALENITKEKGIALVVRSLEAVKTLLDGLEANRGGQSDGPT